MLSANARQTMRNLDVCIQAAYLDTPFVHRLERPLIKFEGGPTPAPGEETGGGGGGDAAPPPVPPPAARRRRQTKAYMSVVDYFLLRNSMHFFTFNCIHVICCFKIETLRNRLQNTWATIQTASQIMAHQTMGIVPTVSETSQSC